MTNVRDDRKARAAVVPPPQATSVEAAPSGVGQGSAAPRALSLAGRLRAVSPEGRYVALLAVVAAGAALLVKYLLFPELSINNDESLYRLQAQTLASGRLFPEAGDPAGSFAPWLAIARHGHYVLKYTPFVPALFALSLLVTGGFGAGLALLAAGAVVVTYRLGLALFDDRRVAALAATLFTASPLVVLLDGMLLAYLPTLVLLELAVLGLLRGLAAARGAAAARGGLRDRRGWALFGAGLAAGTAATVRPYDMLTLLLPLAAWALVTARGGRWWLAWRALLGMVVPAALLLAFNAAATGSPLRLPFTFLEPEDKMGFGVRRLYPTDRAHHFTFPDGLSSVGLHLFLLGGWACGGIVLLGCAIAAVSRRRTGGAANALGVGALVFLGGYVAFWGSWNAAFLWGGIRYVGPFYLLPVLAVLVLLGARGLVDLWAWRPRLGAAGGAVCAGLTALVFATAVPANATMSRHDQDLAAAVDALTGRPLVFLSVDPLYLMHPTSQAANPPALDGRVLWAVTRGGADDLAVLANNPGRTPYLMRIPPDYNRTPGSPSGTRLERLETRTGESITLDVTIDPAPEATTASRLVVVTDAGDISYAVDPNRPAHAQLVIDADGAAVHGLTPTATRARAPGAARSESRLVSLVLYTTPVGNDEKFVDRELAPTVVAPDGSVSVLASIGTVASTPGEAPPRIHLTAAR